MLRWACYLSCTEDTALPLVLTFSFPNGVLSTKRGKTLLPVREALHILRIRLERCTFFGTFGLLPDLTYSVIHQTHLPHCRLIQSSPSYKPAHNRRDLFCSRTPRFPLIVKERVRVRSRIYKPSLLQNHGSPNDRATPNALPVRPSQPRFVDVLSHTRLFFTCMEQNHVKSDITPHGWGEGGSGA